MAKLFEWSEYKAKDFSLFVNGVVNIMDNKFSVARATMARNDFLDHVQKKNWTAVDLSYNVVFLKKKRKLVFLSVSPRKTTF